MSGMNVIANDVDVDDKRKALTIRPAYFDDPPMERSRLVILLDIRIQFRELEVDRSLVRVGAQERTLEALDCFSWSTEHGRS